ncbi:ferritin-like-domain-containing protein [Russula earlei]|uniref:Ferritin-like-domain-containing protein n=1 Tax=Russula earlei TaxID=71964 RepID=A0ACC0UI64_9AGAM|nr:ferritin-like-domain-containing protein [Russula earlei]
MAKHWHQLGFVTQKPSVGPTPIFVEVQRGVIKRDGNLTGPPKDHPPYGRLPLPLPDTPHRSITTLKSLREHLRAAMAVELSTIPLYLYGMYSIKTPNAYINDPRYHDPIISLIHSGVVSEEMLHLSLAGNILLAVGGKPRLYDPHIIPKYPMDMLDRIPPLLLQLRAMTKPNLDTWLEVERPEQPNGAPESDKYHTLGQFYAAIKEGLAYLNARIPNLFDPNTAPYQFASGLGYQPQVRDAGGSVIVTDLASADLAIDIIVDQGEGNPGPFDDKDNLEESHYATFLDLQKGKATWHVHPVITNPTTRGYWELDKRIYQVSVAFDAAYCFLLLTIEKLWTISNDDSRQALVLGNMFSIMMGVLAPLAKFLVTQRIGNSDEVAGPCFGYYPFNRKESALKQLQREMREAIDVYVDVTPETPDQVPVTDYGAQIEQLIPIQDSVNALLDLDTFTTVASPIVKNVVQGAQSKGEKGFARGF